MVAGTTKSHGRAPIRPRAQPGEPPAWTRHPASSPLPRFAVKTRQADHHGSPGCHGSDSFICAICEIRGARPVPSSDRFSLRVFRGAPEPRGETPRPPATRPSDRAAAGSVSVISACSVVTAAPFVANSEASERRSWIFRGCTRSHIIRVADRRALRQIILWCLSPVSWFQTTRRGRLVHPRPGHRKDRPQSHPPSHSSQLRAGQRVRLTLSFGPRA